MAKQQSGHVKPKASSLLWLCVPASSKLLKTKLRETTWVSCSPCAVLCALVCTAQHVEEGGGKRDKQPKATRLSRHIILKTIGKGFTLHTTGAQLSLGWLATHERHPGVGWGGILRQKDDNLPKAKLINIWNLYLVTLSKQQVSPTSFQWSLCLDEHP